MSTAKEQVHALLSKMPDDCSLEDIQYHLYVIEKVRNGLETADTEGSIPQEEVEQRLTLVERNQLTKPWGPQSTLFRLCDDTDL